MLRYLAVIRNYSEQHMEHTTCVTRYKVQESKVWTNILLNFPDTISYMETLFDNKDQYHF